MIDFEDRELYLNKFITNELIIRFPLENTAEITSENIEAESMILNQSVSDDKTFGGCVASKFTIQLFNTTERQFSNDLIGKWINVYLKATYKSNEELYPSTTLFPSPNLFPNEVKKTHEFLLFSGKIDSVSRTKNDDNKFEVIAYDLLHDLWNKNFANSVSGYGGNIPISSFFNTLFFASTGFNIPHTDNFNGYLETAYFGEMLNTGEEITATYILNSQSDWDYKNASIGEVLKNIAECFGFYIVVKPTETATTTSFGDVLGKLEVISLGKDNGIEQDGETIEIYESFYKYDENLGGFNSVRGVNQGTDTKTTGLSLDSEADIEKEYNLVNNPFMFDDSSGGSPTSGRMYGIYMTDTVKNRFLRQGIKYEINAQGMPWLEVGDKINIVYYKINPDGSFVVDDEGEIETEIYTTYILSQELTGIIALMNYMKGE